jgi:hypothetical protein
MGFNSRARGLIGDAHPHPQLPVKASAPEDEHCLGLVDDFLDLRASPVREDLQGLAGYIHAAKYNGSGVDGTVVAHRSQHRCSPGMVPVLARTSEFLPYLVANLLRGLAVLVHFLTKWWPAKFKSLSRKTESDMA